MRKYIDGITLAAACTGLVALMMMVSSLSTLGWIRIRLQDSHVSYVDIDVGLFSVETTKCSSQEIIEKCVSVPTDDILSK